MNDSSEATHYQIELTSRQVLAGLLILLVCLFASFFAGVWIGRSAEASSAASELASVDEVARGGERYDFFTKTDGEHAAGGGARAAGEDEESSTDFPQPNPPDAGDFGPDPDDDELVPTEGDQAAMAGADPDALFDEEAAAGDEDLPPPEEMGRGGRRRRAKARAAAEDAPVTAAPVAAAPAAAAPAQPAAASDTKASATPATRNAAPTPSTKPAAAAEQGFHIQVLATADRAKAEALVSRLAGADFKAFIVPSNEGGRTMYRVRVGPFEDRTIAAGKAKELETRWGLDSWISPGAP